MSRCKGQHPFWCSRHISGAWVAALEKHPPSASATLPSPHPSVLLSHRNSNPGMLQALCE